MSDNCLRTVCADKAGLAAAAATLNGGGVAVIPTDTVYGLAARPDRPDAVARLYSIKARDSKKPIAMLASDEEGAARFVGADAARVGARHWPGALTVVGCGEGVRVTSANLSGGQAATDAAAALASVGLSADIVVDGGVSPGGVASTVVRISDGGRLELLRDGPVKFLTLASGSPRRAKILRDLGVDFFIEKTDTPEVSYPHDPKRTVSENAIAKGAVLAGRRQVLSADTIVWFGGRIYGKPRDLDEAKDFLRELSGRTHTVFTGVAYDGDVKVVESGVTFRKLSEAAICEYVARVKPTDRAGAYDIDESGDLIVEGWTGSYENIMGLPVEPLREWGIV